MSAIKINRKTIRQFHPLNEVADEYIDQLIAKSLVIDYQKGDTLFKKDETTWEAFFLLEGSVEFKKSMFSRETIKAQSDAARHALDNHCPHKLSATAKTACSVLILSRDYIDLVMAWSSEAQYQAVKSHTESAYRREGDDLDIEESDWMSKLLGSPLLAKVPPSHIQELFAQLEDVNVKAGEVIIEAGDPGEHFYIIKQGEAEVIPGATEPDETASIHLSAGDFFGEEALIADAVRSASILMHSNGVLARLEKDNFRRLLQEPNIPHAAEGELVDLMANLKRECEFVDVRLPVEFRHGHVKGSRNIPLSNLREKLKEMDQQKIYLVTPEGGRRSELATHLLSQSGLDAYLINQDGAEVLSATV